MRSILKWVALMCLLLTFWSAVAVVSHHHSSATESGKCVVCVAAHSAAPEASVRLLRASFAPISYFQPGPVSTSERLVVFALSVRPPPAS